jgi:hypothetical protein
LATELTPTSALSLTLSLGHCSKAESSSTLVSFTPSYLSFFASARIQVSSCIALIVGHFRSFCSSFGPTMSGPLLTPSDRLHSNSSDLVLNGLGPLGPLFPLSASFLNATNKLIGANSTGASFALPLSMTTISNSITPSAIIPTTSQSSLIKSPSYDTLDLESLRLQVPNVYHLFSSHASGMMTQHNHSDQSYLDSDSLLDANMSSAYESLWSSMSTGNTIISQSGARQTGVFPISSVDVAEIFFRNPEEMLVPWVVNPYFFPIIVTYIITFVIGVTGNILVICLMLGHKENRK